MITWNHPLDTDMPSLQGLAGQPGRLGDKGDPGEPGLGGRNVKQPYYSSPTLNLTPSLLQYSKLTIVPWVNFRIPSLLMYLKFIKVPQFYYGTPNLLHLNHYNDIAMSA